MYIMFTDETNREPSSDGKFFIYGGLFFRVEQLNKLHEEINNIRSNAGYGSNDEFKFNTHSRPKNVEQAKFNSAKEKVLELCSTLECKFIVYVILHDIIKRRTNDQKIEWAADHVIGRYNKYLESVSEAGICVVDNPPITSQWKYLSDKFTKGLSVHEQPVPLDKIKLFTASCINASHASSAMDIVLGAFRYSINNPNNKDLAKKLMKKLFGMMWHTVEQGKPIFDEKGLVLRPKHVINPTYGEEYKKLINHICDLLK